MIPQIVSSFEAFLASQTCIPQIKCNDFIFNEILILFALYVCFLYSHFIENHPIWILEDGPLISEMVLS
jgi:hypothetical protein